MEETFQPFGVEPREDLSQESLGKAVQILADENMPPGKAITLLMKSKKISLSEAKLLIDDHPHWRSITEISNEALLLALEEFGD